MDRLGQGVASTPMLITAEVTDLLKFAEDGQVHLGAECRFESGHGGDFVLFQKLDLLFSMKVESCYLSESFLPFLIPSVIPINQNSPVQIGCYSTK